MKILNLISQIREQGIVNESGHSYGSFAIITNKGIVLEDKIIVHSGDVLGRGTHLNDFTLNVHLKIERTADNSYSGNYNKTNPFTKLAFQLNHLTPSETIQYINKNIIDISNGIDSWFLNEGVKILGVCNTNSFGMYFKEGNSFRNSKGLCAIFSDGQSLYISDAGGRTCLDDASF